MRRTQIMGVEPLQPLVFVKARTGKEYPVYKINVCVKSGSIAIIKGKTYENVVVRPEEDLENVDYLKEYDTGKRLVFSELLHIYNKSLLNKNQKSGSF